MRRSAFSILAIAMMSAASLYGAAGRGFSDVRDQSRWTNLDGNHHIQGVDLDRFVLDGSVTIMYSCISSPDAKMLKSLSGFYGQYVGRRCQVVISLHDKRDVPAAGKIGVYKDLTHSALPKDAPMPHFLVVVPNGEAIYAGQDYSSAVKAAKKALEDLGDEDEESARYRSINSIIRHEDVRFPWAVVEFAQHVSRYPQDRNDPRLKSIQMKIRGDQGANSVAKFIDGCERTALAAPRSASEARQMRERLLTMQKKLDGMKNDERHKKYAVVYEARLAQLISKTEGWKP